MDYVIISNGHGIISRDYGLMRGEQHDIIKWSHSSCSQKIISGSQEKIKNCS